MKPIITFSDDAAGDGGIAVVLDKLQGFVFSFSYQEPRLSDESGFATTITGTAQIIEAKDNEVTVQPLQAASRLTIPINQIIVIEYQ